MLPQFFPLESPGVVDARHRFSSKHSPGAQVCHPVHGEGTVTHADGLIRTVEFESTVRKFIETLPAPPPVDGEADCSSDSGGPFTWVDIEIEVVHVTELNAVNGSPDHGN